MMARLGAMWLRGAVRRPGRSLVLVLTLGCMAVGTIAALVAADSLDALFVEDARAEWGEVDVELASATAPVLGEGLARVVGDDLADVATATVPRLLLAGVARASEGAGQVPEVQVIGAGPEEQAMAPLHPVAGVVEPWRLGPGEVVLNERLAGRLGAGVGDEVELVVGVPRLEVRAPGESTLRVRDPDAVTVSATVAGIAADSGLADLRRRPSVLVRRDVLQRWVDLPGEVTHVHVRATVDSEAGADAVVRALEPQARRLGLAVDTVAQDALDIAEDEGGQFRSLLLILAVVVVGAAVVATVQLLTAAAEDRSPEIAQLRVHGATPRQLRRLVVVEAVVHAVVGAGAGAVLAFPLAGWLAQRLADHFAHLSAGRGREQVELVAGVEPATVVVGVAVVVVAAALAGRAAARRLAGVHVDTLLRGPLSRLPAMPLSVRRPVVVAMAGSLLLGSGLTDAVAADALRYIGITLLLAAWWMHARRGVDLSARTRLDRRASWVAMLWATGGAAALADFSQGYETGFGVLVVAGVVSVVATSILVAGRLRSLMRLVRSYAPRGPWQAALRTAGAEAEAAPGRSARLAATFGIVLFAAASLQVLGSALAVDPVRQSGGFDLVGTSVVGVDRNAVAMTPGVAASVALESVVVPEDRYGVIDADDERLEVRYPVRLVGVSADLPARQSFRLAEAAPGITDVASALAVVLADGDKAVVDRYARPPGAAVGDDVVLDLGAGPRRYELIGVVDSFLLAAVFVSDSELRQLVPSPGPTLVLATATAGTSPVTLAASLEATGRDVGLEVRTVHALASEVVNVNRTFTDVFALMLLIGLAVALVAVAATLVRSAGERRASLAMLWALGLRRRHVVVTLAAEPVLVAAAGGLLGLLAGMACLRVLFSAGFSDLAFVVDGQRTAVTLAGLLVALLLTCAGTAAWVAPRRPSDTLAEVA